MAPIYSVVRCLFHVVRQKMPRHQPSRGGENVDKREEEFL